jgi:hypothetical protein
VQCDFTSRTFVNGEIRKGFVYKGGGSGGDKERSARPRAVIFNLKIIAGVSRWTKMVCRVFIIKTLGV